MIEILFKFGADIILVVIRGNDITFGNTAYGAKLANIEGLKLSHEGVIKEFPDLKDNEDWRNIAITRFKEHISKLGSETEKAEYIIDDLSKWGYKAIKICRNGFRPEAIG